MKPIYFLIAFLLTGLHYQSISQKRPVNMIWVKCGLLKIHQKIGLRKPTILT